MKNVFHKNMPQKTLGDDLLKVLNTAFFDPLQARILIQAGADLSVRDAEGHTALLLSLWQGDGVLIDMLIDQGADVHCKTYSDETTLMIATYANDLKAVTRLLKERVDINAVNDMGTSALMIAAWEGSFDVVKALVDAGADLSLRNCEDQTALMLARSSSRRKKDHAIVKYLKETPEMRAQAILDKCDKERHAIIISLEGGTKEAIKRPEKINFRKRASYKKP